MEPNFLYWLNEAKSAGAEGSLEFDEQIIYYLKDMRQYQQSRQYHPYWGIYRVFEVFYEFDFVPTLLIAVNIYRIFYRNSYAVFRLNDERCKHDDQDILKIKRTLSPYRKKSHDRFLKLKEQGLIKVTIPFDTSNMPF